jgi:flagellar motor switch protein FliN/FliY
MLTLGFQPRIWFAFRMATQTFDWIKQLPDSVLQLDEVPLFGKAPPFPWEKLTKELSALFQIGKLKIEPGNSQWRTPEELTEGIGAEPATLFCSFSSLEGSLAWMMSKENIESLMLAVLTISPQNLIALDPDFESGFYNFLAAQVINTINKLDFDKNLSPSLHREESAFKQPAFCIDVSITLPEKTVMGRVVLSAELCHSWRERFANRKLNQNFNTPLGQKLQVTIHLEAGKTDISLPEWSKVVPGDFIILDFCSFEPDSDKGRIMMTIGGIPMFRARLKQGSIKILEFPLYQEVATPMNKNPTPKDEEEDEDEFDDSDLEETEDEDLDEEEEEDEEESLSDEETDLTDEDTDIEAPPPPTKEKQPTPPLPASEKKALKPEELPLTLVVEVGRIQMSIQKLIELQPGNVLELDIHPENGVDLVINGSRVGKGELLKVGETLGVRVLDMG